ncbi:PEP-CTERM sorting domain-containing protein [Oscillatoria salina]|uniref:PEP-CTERM sorting domain-containing protein n=1 Tax=Oscillatoria salina TaxID=331517 RepID=UPI0013B611C9|nr:PEP-CTERM sorting domain-containing protein [Oscillatoria salina]MBZ8179938.1 PEP-CTERM sorting domain-containing protein [Oscillatoria salina IIICB1]NET86837.1 PEP-CTERM sorting domain-containing protein [Kamptonema sp. SIO1D9]
MSQAKQLTKLAVGSAIAALGLFGADSALAVKIDFDEAVAPGTGVAVTDQWEADYGVKFSSSTKELWLYNSDCSGNTCTGDDPDLATGAAFGTDSQGNVLIIQENLGAGAEPDDNNGRGTFTFDFSSLGSVLFENIALLDLDEAGLPKFEFTFADGLTQVFSNLNDSDAGVTLLNPSRPKNNSLREYAFNLENVVKLDVTLPGSGAVAYLQYQEAETVPEPATVLSLLAFGALGATGLIKRKQKEC